MNRPDASSSALLDQPAATPEEVVAVERAMGRLVGGGRDIVLVPAEAILALEAIAASVAAPGRRVLNVVTGPYGAVFGDWLRRGGAVVADLATGFDEVVSPDAVVAAVETHRPEILAVVHAEAATGGTNPMAEIAAIARAAGALLVVDAVSSIGAEPVPAAEWDADFVAIGAQKSLAGPPTPSAVAVSERGWALVDANPNAPRGSSLSLTDWRDAWNRGGRTAVPGLPSWLDVRAMLAALDRIEAEGLPAVHERHRRAAEATLAGIAVLGLEPWQADAAARAPIVTTVRIPDGPRGAALRDGELGGILSPGNGGLRGRLLRVNHYGRAAEPAAVEDAIARLADALASA